MRMQAQFMERQQALLHGDLHTGSLMVTEHSTHAIDAEFACVGPIAFDVGKMAANLLIAYFASAGLEKASGGPSRLEQRRWLLTVRGCLAFLSYFGGNVASQYCPTSGA
jgi:5-methylthioribose kinase